jgi:hypothetical protein
MFDASHRRKRKELPEVEIPPEVADEPLPRAPKPDEPKPFTIPLADFLDLKAKIDLSAARLELIQNRKKQAEETEQVAAILAAWMLMND